MKTLFGKLLLGLWLMGGIPTLGEGFTPENPPIFLEYDGRPLNATTFRMEKTVTAQTDALVEQRVTYTAWDGKLQVRLDVRTYRKFPVWEYTLWLTNLSQEAPTGVVRDIQACRLPVPLSQTPQTPTLYTIRGSQSRPDDFIPQMFSIPPGTTESLTQSHGRSSNDWIPFLDLSLSETSGMLFAIGWTGSWEAHFTHPSSPDDPMRVVVRMGDSRFRLAPGESLRQPSMTIFTRQGMSRRAFQTVVHRFMREHKVPRDARGNLLPPILAVTAGGGNKPPQKMRDILEYVRENRLPFDTYWVDAGWYGAPHEDELNSNCGPHWWKYVGDWRVNTTTHPTGDLLPIADAVHAAGMKFLLWFEPERMMDGAPILETHPEFRHGNLVDFGNPEALGWIQNTVYGMIEKHRIDVYRQDFNMDPRPVWDAMDQEADVVGLAQARHITGLYRFLDEMRARFPNILLENCASGGRRIDMEMISRAHTYCRSDYYIGRKPKDTAFLLGQNATLNTLPFLPFQGGESNGVPVGDDYAAFSVISSGTVFTPSDFDGGIIRRAFTADETAWFQKIFTTAARMKPFYMGDFYPLVEPCSADDDLWCAWQADRPDQQAGFAIAFRRGENNEEARVFQLGNIDPAADYDVEEYGGEKSVVKGSALQAWNVALPPRAFRLIFYRKR
ncbi:MAG: alpha-galactosidase [Planctomycetia bacterium]|nr:alpha-galactosidase [Planctomycetia bacterium]